MTLAQRTFAEVEIRRARRTDNETSKAAAAHSHGLAAEHRLLILAAMRQDAGTWIAHEVAAKCGLTSVQVSRRFRELVDDGEIRATGETRPTPSGRPAQCYETITTGTP